MISVNEIDAILRKILIRQSGLDDCFVRNADSRYGSDIDIEKEDGIFESVDTNSSILFFIVNSRESSSDVTLQDDESLIQVSSYAVQLMCYGERSAEVIDRLIARFRSASVRRELLSKDIYLETITSKTMVREFKNDKNWLRTDCQINISCEHHYEEESYDTQFEALNSMTIKKELTIDEC